MTTPIRGHKPGGWWTLILIATGFNLLFEYALRGINNLQTQPYLPVILTVIYLVYFTMLEDLIVRFRLNDVHLMVITFFFGTVYISFISGVAFISPTAAGINWGRLLYINLIWWGALQGVLTFYIANRLSLRDWGHRRLGWIGWSVAILVNLVVIRMFQRSELIPKARPTGLIAVLIVLAATLVLFRLMVPRTASQAAPPEFKRSLFLDGLAALTTLFFLFAAVFLTFDPIQAGTSNVNAASLRLVSIWTAVLAVFMLGYRLYSRRGISV